MQIAIVLYPGFTALDFIGPYESLRWLPGAEIRLVWHETGPIAADSGIGADTLAPAAGGVFQHTGVIKGRHGGVEITVLPDAAQLGVPNA